ncbi:MAG: hypothetical protein IPQ16_01460 [Geobacteraceae bacterium]|nr:hypothetical protein [Geobacteraceae bacterium]
MKDEKLPVLVRRFAVAARAHHSAVEDMDEGRANAQARAIQGLYATITHEGDAGREALMVLLDSENQVVAGMAAVFSLRYCTHRSLEVLRRLAASGGLLGFRAGVALERWENGVWEDP